MLTIAQVFWAAIGLILVGSAASSGTVIGIGLLILIGQAIAYVVDHS